MTSDIFKKKKNKLASSIYHISGADTNISFRSSLYDEKTVEITALHRAVKLGCQLFREDPDGSFYQIIPPVYHRKNGRIISIEPLKVVAVKKREKRRADVTVEMLNNNSDVQGIVAVY